MARSITSGFQDEIEASILSPAILVKAEFDGGDVRLWSGYGSITYDSETYTGTGHLGRITTIEETQRLQANGVTFQISGIPSSLISVTLSEDYQGRPITCWFAVLNSAGQLISDPYQTFSGKMDVMEIHDDGDTSIISIRAESDLIDLRESREKRYTPEDQKIKYPSDQGLDFVPTIQDTEVVWGS